MSSGLSATAPRPHSPWPQPAASRPQRRLTRWQQLGSSLKTWLCGGQPGSRCGEDRLSSAGASPGQQPRRWGPTATLSSASLSSCYLVLHGWRSRFLFSKDSANVNTMIQRQLYAFHSARRTSTVVFSSGKLSPCGNLVQVNSSSTALIAETWLAVPSLPSLSR